MQIREVIEDAGNDFSTFHQIDIHFRSRTTVQRLHINELLNKHVTSTAQWAICFWECVLQSLSHRIIHHCVFWVLRGWASSALGSYEFLIQGLGLTPKYINNVKTVVTRCRWCTCITSLVTSYGDRIWTWEGSRSVLTTHFSSLWMAMLTSSLKLCRLWLLWYWCHKFCIS